MTRTCRPTNLSTKSARAKLATRAKGHWQTIDVDVCVGWRRSGSGGVWLLRSYQGDGRYAVEQIGIADDHRIADGESVLNFQQAKNLALELASVPPPGPVTVNIALDAYFERLEGKGKRCEGARRRGELHIAPVLGELPVDSLTRDVLDRWLVRLAEGKDGIATRARRASANRVLTILKSALNMAYLDGDAASDRAWKSCKAFPSVDAPRERFFTTAELTRLSMQRVQATSADWSRALFFQVADTQNFAD